MYAESSTTEMTTYRAREPPEKSTLRDFWAKESAVNAFLQTSSPHVPTHHVRSSKFGLGIDIDMELSGNHFLYDTPKKHRRFCTIYRHILRFHVIPLLFASVNRFSNLHLALLRYLTVLSIINHNHIIEVQFSDRYYYDNAIALRK